MANLEAKFTELQELLTTNQTAMIAAMGLQQSSLDTLAINSALSLAALGFIKSDTGLMLGKLDTIVQLLQDMNTAIVAPDVRLDNLTELTRLESIQSDAALVRKLLGTPAQYLASETGQENTIFGRLDYSLLQLAGAFVGPDGFFPGSSTFFGGVMASLFINSVSISNAGYDTVELLTAIAGTATSTNGWAQSINGEVTGIVPLLEAIRVCSCATVGPPVGTGCDPVIEGILETGITTSGESGTMPLSVISVWVQPGTSGNPNGDSVASSAGCFVVFPGATSNHSGAAGNFIELNGFSIFNAIPPRRFAVTVESAINSPVVKFYILNADSGIFQEEANLTAGSPLILDPANYTAASKFVIVVRGDNQNDTTAGTVGVRVCPA